MFPGPDTRLTPPGGHRPKAKIFIGPNSSIINHKFPPPDTCNLIPFFLDLSKSMLTATIPTRRFHRGPVPGNRLAWPVAMVCLLAWTTMAARPLLAIESALRLISPPASRGEAPVADQASAWTLLPTSTASKPEPWTEKQAPPEKQSRTSPAATLFHQLAARQRPDPLQPHSVPAPTVLPSPTAEQLPGTPASQAARERKVAAMTTDIALPAGALPQNMAALQTATSPGQSDRRLESGWSMTRQLWAATNLQTKPLYFEEINLERYGYTSCRLLQPLISATRFFATIPALPYKMVLEPPCRLNFALGYHRPGSCAPWHWQRLPLSARAGLVEAGVVVGLVFLIP